MKHYPFNAERSSTASQMLNFTLDLFGLKQRTVYSERNLVPDVSTAFNTGSLNIRYEKFQIFKSKELLSIYCRMV